MVAAWVEQLAVTGPRGLGEHDLVELITGLERLKAAGAALQARATTSLLDQQLTASDAAARPGEPGDVA
ncbi:hypothetical protein JL106_15240 [Nakamurella sp. YIM 132084]|uniref:Uncharacterized protein n=1 Tax=Nakamurella leprariae TaxID=2803911 RepID=A0A938YFK9_9ACTN|nr:hypothetical protein [Nakamurella leprariae]